MKYAVVRIKGKQYIAREGKEFLVDKADSDAPVEVLLAVNDKKIEIGKPTLPKVKVVLDVTTEVEKGDKVRSLTFKAKARQRRSKASRPLHTRFKVKSISL